MVKIVDGPGRGNLLGEVRAIKTEPEATSFRVGSFTGLADNRNEHIRDTQQAFAQDLRTLAKDFLLEALNGRGPRNLSETPKTLEEAALARDTSRVVEGQLGQLRRLFSLS